MGLLSKVESITAGLAIEPIKTFDSMPKTLNEKIAQFQKNRGNFNCILFEIPGPSTGEPAGLHSGDREGFCRKVAEMLDKTGTIIPLNNGRPLVLLPLTMDRELISHRISKSLDSAPIFSIEADCPEKIINHINSLP